GEGWDNAVDGDTQGWDGTVTASDKPPYAIFAFADNSTKSVFKIRLMTDTGVGFRSRWVTQFSVKVSTTDTNASSFILLLNKAAKNGGAWQEYPLPPTQAKYIKLILDQPSSGWWQIGEFEVYVNQ
ncbi:MAG: discoidin domain-containing protein, partial [Planctomycetaceae bacterium]